jgi:copper homeostasis protein
MILEACVETFDEAISAQQRGAHRIELCARLHLDGLTPAPDLIKRCCAKLTIPVKVMIRPRPGGFVYSERELLAMEYQIALAKKLGASAVVFGLLTDNGCIDYGSVTKLVKAASPLQVTFHKAIDLMEDPALGVAQLIEIQGLTHILSSGGKPTALEGAEVIRRMITLAKQNVKIIVAGKVSSENVHEIAALTGAEEFHGRRIVGDLF